MSGEGEDDDIAEGGEPHDPFKVSHILGQVPAGKGGVEAEWAGQGPSTFSTPRAFLYIRGEQWQKVPAFPSRGKYPEDKLRGMRGTIWAALLLGAPLLPSTLPDILPLLQCSGEYGAGGPAEACLELFLK